VAEESTLLGSAGTVFGSEFEKKHIAIQRVLQAIFRSPTISMKSSRMPESDWVLVTGAGGFIGHHLVKRLKSEGYWVYNLPAETGGIGYRTESLAEISSNNILINAPTLKTSRLNGVSGFLFSSSASVYAQNKSSYRMLLLSAKKMHIRRIQRQGMDGRSSLVSNYAPTTGRIIASIPASSDSTMSTDRSERTKEAKRRRRQRSRARWL
jgi:hypothetical protein